MSNVAIRADKLRVTRDGTKILRGLTFEIYTGQITGLIGPSGSGKTTLMRSIIGAQRITSGQLTILGESAGSPILRSKIGYVSQSPSVYNDLTVWQNLAYFGVILKQKKEVIQQVIKQVDLIEQEKQLVSTLSGGQKARVGLAVALLGQADLLIMDEPTVGLDPILRQNLWDLFFDLARQGKTLLISSHVMDEAEDCPDLLLMREGKILRHKSKTDLLKETNSQTVKDAFLKLVTEGSNK
jgi:ABC-2 type transport system ATP-binding protein